MDMETKWSKYCKFIYSYFHCSPLSVSFAPVHSHYTQSFVWVAQGCWPQLLTITHMENVWNSSDQNHRSHVCVFLPFPSFLLIFTPLCPSLQTTVQHDSLKSLCQDKIYTGYMALQGFCFWTQTASISVPGFALALVQEVHRTGTHGVGGPIRRVIY